jgi:hypothetical protein
MNLISEIIFLIGNKNDLEKQRQVSYEQAKRVLSLYFCI